MHVLKFPADLARTQWKKAIEELEDTLVIMRTNPSMFKVWKSRLTGLQDQTQFPLSQFSLGETTYHAVIEQDSINWSNFLMGRLRSKWIDTQYEWIVMTSTKCKCSSTQLVHKEIIVVWKVGWKQWEHRNPILHSDQHSRNQREIRNIDTQIQQYKTQYQPALYPLRDKALFLHSTRFIHQHPKQIKQQWLQSVAMSILRKITADATPVSQEKKLLSNWFRESDRYGSTITNSTGTSAMEENSIILFARPLTRDNNNITEKEYIQGLSLRHQQI